MYEHLRTVTCDNDAARVIRSLPRHYYTDPEHYEREKIAIFYKAWICLGHVSMARKPGDYFSGDIAGQRVLVIRGKEGQLRAFYNNCCHRGHILAEGSGSCRRIVCRYHAWSYNLDGRLFRAPNSEGVEGFDPSKIRLNELRLQVLAGIVFVTIDDNAPDLATLVPGLEEEILGFKPNVVDQEWVADRPYEHRCNWKVSVENFSECYHCGPVHKYLATNVIDPSSYQLSADGLVQRHVVAGLDGEMVQRIWHIFPNTAIGLYPIPNFGLILSIRHMYPTAFNRAVYHYRWFCDLGLSAETVREYAAHHAETTGAEDAQVAEGVQKGMENISFDRGFLLANPSSGVSSEHVIAHFHALLEAALAA